MMKRVFALILAFVMLIGSVPVTGFANTQDNSLTGTVSDSTVVTSEPTKAPTGESTEEPSVPVDQSVTLGSQSVRLTAPEGVFPAGAVFRAAAAQAFEIGDILSNAVSNLEVFAAYDLQVLAEDGTALQPEGSVSMVIQAKDVLFGAENATVRVYYVNIDEAVTQQIPCQVDFEAGTVAFVLDHFSVYAITVSDLPVCYCENQCIADVPNADCGLCMADASGCWGSPTTLSIEEVAALFEALPDYRSITPETSEEEKNELSAQLDAAMTAYYALMDTDSKAGAEFERRHEALLVNALTLNDVLTGNYGVPYDGYYTEAYIQNSANNATITLSEDMLDEAPLVVRHDGNTILVYQVAKISTRTYAYTRTRTNSTASNDDYIITAASAAGASYQQTITGRTASTTIAPISTGSETNAFELFYIYSNNIPNPYYYTDNRNASYGPSGNGEPMVTVTVNTDMLKTYSSVVVGSGSGTSWYFTPKYNEMGQVTLENSQSFWDAVKACMNATSRQALVDTGMDSTFVGYILKRYYSYSWFNSGYENHGDGILNTVTDTMYVAELHVTENGSTNYFGSVVTINEEEPKQMTDVLALCDQNLGGTVYWEPAGEEALQHPYTRVGYFYRMQGNTPTVIKVTVTQMDNKNDLEEVNGTDIRYVEKSSAHYLARFNMTLEDVTDEVFIQVTYTDGVENETIFEDVAYPAQKEHNVPTYNGTPMRTGYTFAGWKLEGTDITYTDAQIAQLTVAQNAEDMTFVAQWTPVNYTVLWKNDDGTELEKDTGLTYGTMPSYDGATPSKPETAQYTYSFAGWTPAVTAISGEQTLITYTAIYQQHLRSYSVLWYNDTQLLETDWSVPYGTIPSYNGAVPAKAATAEFTYTFSGWSPVISPVTGDVRYYAQFAETTNHYTVTWVDYDGTTLETDTNVTYGTMPHYGGSAPTRAATPEYTYTFTGWTPEVSEVAGHVTYRATYSQMKNQYTVTWLGDNNAVLQSGMVDYGTIPSYTGETPTKPATTEFTYSFAYWSPEIEPVTGDATYVAQFTEVRNRYTVTWIYQGGMKTETDENVEYGSNPSFADTANLDYSSGNYDYFFIGWTIDSGTEVHTQEQVNAMTVEGDMTLTAQYNPVPKGYAVNVNVVLDAVLQNGNMTGGTRVSIEQMLGSGVTLFLNADRTQRIPLIWNAADKCYTSALVPNGTYYVYSSQDENTPLSSHPIIVDGAANERDVYFWSVTYDLLGGTLGGSDQNPVSYHRGAVTVTRNNPTKEGYTFLGWQLAEGAQLLQKGDSITADIQHPLVLTAQWANAKVNLKVIINHRYGGTHETAFDSNPSGNLRIDLAYRRNSTESYVEMVGQPEIVKTDWYDGDPNEDHITIKTYNDLYTGLDNALEYSANVFLSGYIVKSHSVVKQEDADVYDVTVELYYEPALFNLTYRIQADESMDASLIPEAVDIKIHSLKGSAWSPVSVHIDQSVDVMFNQTANGQPAGDDEARYGSGSYASPIYDDEHTLNYYRVAAAGFTIAGAHGSHLELNASETGDWQWASDALEGYFPAGAYTAKLVFTPASGDSAEGVYGENVGTAENPNYQQQGDLLIQVQAHPATVKLDLNYDNKILDTIPNVFVIPDLSGYAPQREGYTFRGWYLDKECTQPAAAGEYLELDAETTLYAKWNAHITVTGTVTVSATYILEDGIARTIPESDRLTHVTVRLMGSNALTNQAATATLTYSGDYGTGTYTITDVPDDGTEYTVSVLQAQGAYYSDAYLNEPESLTEATNYSAYTPADCAVVMGTEEPLTATVHAYLQFIPTNFDLHYTIDATAIGSGYRPTGAKTLILYDDDVSSAVNWAVISQMVTDSGNVPQSNVLSGGAGSYTYPVWQTHADGALYNYALQLQELTFTTGKVTSFADQPFQVRYEPAFAYYTPIAGEQPDQNQVLNILVTPRSYTIAYVSNGGTIPQTAYPTSYTWSFETDLAGVIPTRTGYSFAGWYTSPDLQEASRCTVISADVHERVTLYAKWTPDSYNISYHLDGGTVTGNPTTYTPETETFTLVNPIREGYTFLGWSGTGLTSPSKEVTVAKGSTGHRHYTAHWEQNQYTITIAVTNGTSDPTGPVIRIHGESQTITFTPHPGYALESVTVDGAAAELTEGSYTFANITRSHSIQVVYSPDENGDDVPDVYQATVTYAVVNGSFAQGSTHANVFNLKTYQNGIWVDHAPTLGNTIPTVYDEASNPTGEMFPDEGYEPVGRWLRDIDATTPVIGDEIYTWYFTQPILYSVTYPDADRSDGNLPISITGSIPHGTKITVDPNGGSWTPHNIDGLIGSYTEDQTFPLKQNVGLGYPAREHYEFQGWSQSSGTGDVTYVYTAIWEPEIFTITYNMPYAFFPAEGNPTTYTVETDTFTVNNPTREGYTFTGWTGTGLTEATLTVSIPKGSFGNREYTPTWTANTNTPYRVEYYLEDLEWAGETATYSLDADRSRDEIGTTGTRVEEEPLDITGFTLNAERSRVSGTIQGNGSLILLLYYDRECYTVTWKHPDGQTLETDTEVKYGEIPSFDGETPAKAATDRYTYTFTGWSPEIEAVSKNVTYTAQFSQTVNKYTITWLDYDTQPLATDEVEYGTVPVYPFGTPTREPTARFDFRFKEWTPEVEAVTGNATYTAVYTAVPRHYTGTVRIYVDGSLATDQQMYDALQGMKLYLGGKEYVSDTDTAGRDAYYELTGSNGSYTTDRLQVGDYRLYMKKDGDSDYTLVSDSLYLTIVDRAAEAELHMYSVTYDMGYDDTSDDSDDAISSRYFKQYHIQGSRVTVVDTVPAQDGYYFQGWQLNDSQTLMHKSELLTASIDTSYILTAQWSNAIVDLTVIVNHLFDHPTNPGENTNPSGNMTIDLTYRANDNEPYVELTTVEEVTMTAEQWYDEGTTTDHVTTTTFDGIFTALDDRFEYAANVFLSGYVVRERTVVKTDAGYHVTVKLDYNPELFELKYSVTADKDMDGSLVPQAVDIKIYKKTDTDAEWAPISAHENSSVDILLSKEVRTGSGSYRVPVYADGTTPFYYRSAAVGFTVIDAGGELVELTASEPAALGNDVWHFLSDAVAGKYPAGAYTAELTFTPWENSGHIGAHGVDEGESFVQHGELELVVYAHPGKVILNSAGGHWDDPSEDQKELENRFTVPDLTAAEYVPVKEGYTFQGWFDESGKPAASGSVLNAMQTITYTARWARNLTIEGTVTVSNVYDDHVLLQPQDRAGRATVTLHRYDGQSGNQTGSQERVQVGGAQQLTLVTAEDGKTSASTYSFANVPNDGSQYYITVTVPGYSVTYWNEVLAEGADYTATNYDAVDTNEDHIAAVNAYAVFAPDNFDLIFEIDASALDADFRPTGEIPVYVLADSDTTANVNWDVISQMQSGNPPADDPSKAVQVTIDTFGDNAGKGSGKYSVWKFSPLGPAYNYAIRIIELNMKLDGEEETKLTVTSDQNFRDMYENLPFWVEYRYPTFYKASTNAQDILLTATLRPRTYTVTLDPNGGKWDDESTGNRSITHTWSHETTDSFALTRDGYVFDGWESVEGSMNSIVASDTVITVAPALQEAVTLRAKWIKIRPVTFLGSDLIRTYTGAAQTITWYGGDAQDALITSTLPEGYTFENLTYSVTGTDVDTYNATISGTVVIRDAAGKDVTNQFAVNVGKSGSLTIYPAPLTVSAVDVTKVYDGYVSTLDYTLDGLVGQDAGKTAEALDITVNLTGPAITAVNVGQYSVTPEVEGSPANYYLETANGTLTITPMPITPVLTVEDKVYDRTANVAAYTIQADSLVDTDVLRFQVASVVFDSNQVNRDASGAVIDRTVTATGVTLAGENAGNYQLTVTTLTASAKITPRTLTVYLEPLSRVYDGTNTVVMTYDSHEGLIDPDQVIITSYPITGTMTDAEVGVGKEVSVASEPVLARDANGKYYQDGGNYTLATVVGTVTISQRRVILTSADAEKTYDGMPLTAPTVTVGGDGFVNADLVERPVATGSLTGSIDEVTAAVNTPITYKLKDGIEDNYDVQMKYGTLTVYPDENQNQIPDADEHRYTVTYVKAANSNMTADVVHQELLSGLSIPEAPMLTMNTGYQAAQSWTLTSGTEGVDGKIGTTNLVYEMTVTPMEYSIVYVLEEDAVNATSNPEKYTYGEEIASFEEAAREGYVFMGWYADSSFATPVTGIAEGEHGDKTLYPKWETDILVDPDADPDPEVPGDGVPDIYQSVITYRVVNGTWEDATTADQIYVLTHTRKNAQGQTEPTGNKLGNTVPTGMMPAVGYTEASGSWETGKVPTADTPVPTDSITYSYTFGDKIDYTVTITVVNGTAKQGETTYKEPVIAEHGETPVFTFTADKNFALDTAQIYKTVEGKLQWVDIALTEDGAYTLAPMTESVSIKVVFSKDEWNADDDTETSDGIPDNRQVWLQYRSEDDNGTVTGAVDQVFTLDADDQGRYIGEVTPDTVTAEGKTGYALESWLDGENNRVANPLANQIVEGGRTYTFTARWGIDLWTDGEATEDTTDSDALGTTTDPKSDGIADSHQVVFHFQVEGAGGSISGEILQVITLEPNASGVFAASIAPEQITVTPDSGYRLDQWMDAAGNPVVDPFTVRPVEGGKIYTFIVSFAVDWKTVSYADAEKLVLNVPVENSKTVQASRQIQVDPNGGIWQSSTEMQTLTVTENITLADPVRSGYVFRGWKCTDGPGQQNDGTDIRYVYTAQWEKDVEGAVDSDGEEIGDGIPDKYQKKVVFRIRNGTWASDSILSLLGIGGTSEDIVHYLILTDANENWSETGTAYLKPLVPTNMRANWGYHNGSWDVVPPDYVSGTDTAEYTYSYVAKSLGNPKTGDDSNILLWMYMLLASLAAMVTVLIVERKKMRHKTIT